MSMEDVTAQMDTAAMAVEQARQGCLGKSRQIVDAQGAVAELEDLLTQAYVIADRLGALVGWGTQLGAETSLEAARDGYIQALDGSGEALAFELAVEGVRRQAQDAARVQAPFRAMARVVAAELRKIPNGRAALSSAAERFNEAAAGAAGVLQQDAAYRAARGLHRMPYAA